MVHRQRLPTLDYLEPAIVVALTSYVRPSNTAFRMETLCPQLWDGCYVNREGDVFACCHMSPSSYGNIHRAKLREIVNSPAALRAREDSLRGNLACFSNCNLLNKDSLRKKEEKGPWLDYERLRRLHISFGEACNIRCVMCDHPQRHAKSPILLDPKVVIENIELGPFSTIIIQGGEPLFLKECLDFMSHLEHEGKRYTLLTNGVLIDDVIALRLARYAKSVNISLNGATKQTHQAVNRGSRFDRVIENVQRLRTARAELGTSLAIVGHMTITTSNVHEVPLFLQTFRDLGFDRVNFGYVKESVPAYLAGRPDLRIGLRSENSRLMSQLRSSQVDALRLRMLGICDPESTESGGAGENEAPSVALPMAR